MDTGVQNKRKWSGCGVSMTVRLAVAVAVVVVVLSAILPADAQQEDEKSLLALMKSNEEGTVSADEEQGDHDFDGEAQDDGGHVREVRDIDIGSFYPQGIRPGIYCVRYCRTTHCHGWWSRRRRCHVSYYCCQRRFHFGVF